MQAEMAHTAHTRAKTSAELAKTNVLLSICEETLSTCEASRPLIWGPSVGETCCADRDPRNKSDPMPVATRPKIAVLFYGVLSPVCVDSQSRLLEIIDGDAFVSGWLGSGQPDRSMPWPGVGNDTFLATQMFVQGYGSHFKGGRVRPFDNAAQAELEIEQRGFFSALAASAMRDHHLKDIGGLMPVLGKYKSIEGANQLKTRQEKAQGWKYDYVLLTRQDWCPIPDPTLAMRLQMMHDRGQIAPKGIYMIACSDAIPEISKV
eukprot:TRINITY_DN5048_c0_g1_i4.p1 TRINITY_DN5048_c0_g1~~TRINITY_DN5048_c0_g1_i4.p1  ORF type:complete len:262 (+),score=19.02 TRINITY_DN5048_c0_g1_i4:147-932(+)